MAHPAGDPSEADDVQRQLEGLFDDGQLQPGDESGLADQLEQLLADGTDRRGPRRDVRRTPIGQPTAPRVPSAPSERALVEAVMAAVTTAVDETLARVLPDLVEESVSRAVREALTATIPQAIAVVLPAAIEQVLPAAIEQVLPDAIDEAITDLIEHMAPASPALERAHDALRRLRARSAG